MNEMKGLRYFLDHGKKLWFNLYPGTQPITPGHSLTNKASALSEHVWGKKKKFWKRKKERVKHVTSFCQQGELCLSSQLAWRCFQPQTMKDHFSPAPTSLLLWITNVVCKLQIQHCHTNWHNRNLKCVSCTQREDEAHRNLNPRPSFLEYEH